MKIFTDLETYNDSKSKFEDWWMKMQAWPDCNPKQFVYIDADGDEIINSKNCTYAIFFQLCGAKNSHFSEVELQKLAAEDTHLYDWKILTIEIEGLFCLQLQVDWAKNKISRFMQGDLNINTFITKWQLLYHQSKIDATMDIWLLKNKSPHTSASNYSAQMLARPLLMEL